MLVRHRMLRPPSTSRSLGRSACTRVHHHLVIVVSVSLLGAACALPTSSDSSPCKADTWRCDGTKLQHCGTHSGGLTGGVESPTYQKGSPNSWSDVADCGQDRCISPADHDAFCALDRPTTACSAEPTGYACDGSTLVQCVEGYPVSHKLCKACDPSGNCYIGASGDSTCCVGGAEHACKGDSDCASGLRCDGSTCKMPCDCPEGARCSACDVLYLASTLPTSGAPFTWTCRTGFCSLDYHD